MKKILFCFVFLISLFLISCGGSSSSSSETVLTNTEKAYQQTLKENVEVYCGCITPYKKYLDSKKEVKDAASSKMGREMSKFMQKCIQDSDNENQDIIKLTGTLTKIEKVMYNNQFSKLFKKTCPENAEILIKLWGGVGPLPTTASRED